MYLTQKKDLFYKAEEEFIKRIHPHAVVNLYTINKWTNVIRLPRVVQQGYAIGLFVDGQAYSSELLAEKLQELMNQGNSHLVFAIGGPNGIPAGVASEIVERWSLSPLTFGHQLARLLLA